ncbi:hypothetical protein Tco_0072050 [Tanacetum coccineum]
MVELRVIQGSLKASTLKEPMLLMEHLDPIASTRWLAVVEGAFRTSNCKEKNKVNFASNFLRDSAKMWWEGKKKFNDLILYCLEYHGNENLKVERFQRMLRDAIQEVISPFKCTTLDDLLSRARVREADLLRKKNKEAKETKRKLKFGDRDTKKPKHDHSRRSGGTQIKTPCKKCHKNQSMSGRHVMIRDLLRWVRSVKQIFLESNIQKRKCNYI